MWLGASALLVVTAGTPADAAPLPACAGGGPCVIVEVVDGQTVTDRRQYSVDELTGPGADIDNANYPLSGGGSVTVAHGTSLQELAAAAPTGGPITYAEVVAPDTWGRHPLTTTNLGPAGSNGFQGNLQPAFYSYGLGQVNYIRPQRSDTDQNNTQGPDAGNLFSDAGGGGALLLVLHTSGHLLDVAVSAQPVGGSDRSYTLSTDQPASSTFDWVLPDASHQSGATVSYAFRAGDQSGAYDVGVAVDAPDGSFGWGVTTLRAGAAPAPSPSASQTGTGGGGHASSGPTKRPTRSASGPPRPGSSGTATAAPTAGPTTGPTSAPTLPAPTGSATAPDRPTRAPSASATPTGTPTPAEQGDQVTGILLAAGEPVDQGEDPAVSDPPSQSADAAPIGRAHLSVPAGLLVALGGVLLLGAGALSESERVRSRLRRWARMGA